MKGAGGASGPTRPARTSIPGSGSAAGGSPRSSRPPILDGDAETATFLRGELARQRVRLEGLPADPATGRPKAEEEIRVVIAKADPKNPDQIGNMTYEAASRRALQAKGDAERGKALFAAQSCRACHTDADGQTPKGPHLVDIGKRYSPAELVESILKPSAKIAQGYEAYSFAMADGRVFSGFVVSEGALDRPDPRVFGRPARAEAVGHRGTPAGRSRRRCRRGSPATLTPEQLADLVAYLQSLDPIEPSGSTDRATDLRGRSDERSRRHDGILGSQ